MERVKWSEEDAKYGWWWREALNLKPCIKNRKHTCGAERTEEQTVDK